ncbi:DUF3304 domain-containing protein [Pseudomonas sp. JH-2]|uniref:DUF3304 domain-containing protein n=1 Tax=Pseudomonas sp. JH-2 TaxID=3114998 RepID=UPI002E26B998|nr:DUF3304 domain-containing protein [Pseudomonas sp. JH-2]
MRNIVWVRMLLGFLSLALVACSSADNDNETAAGNIEAINHTTHGINWLKVNGYRADGGGGSSCCIVMPVKWRPGLKARIEWEVDPDPYADAPPLGTDEFRAFMVEHKKSYKHYSATVDIPEWPGTESCDFKVHFLTCNRVQVTTACALYGQPNYPINEPLRMKEPAVCQK